MSFGLMGPLGSYADLTHGLCKNSVYSHCFDSEKSLIPSLCRPSLLFLSLDFSGGCKIITPLLCEICSQVSFLCMKIIKLLKGIKRIIINQKTCKFKFKFIKKINKNTEYDVPLLAVSYSYSRRAVVWCIKLKYYHTILTGIITFTT